MGMMNDFDDLDFEDAGSEEPISTSRGSNRTFLIVAGILGGILLIALLAIAAYAVLYLPSRQTGQQTQVSEINATNTAVAEEAQLTAIAKQITFTPTFTATLPPTHTPTLTPSSTSTPVLAPTNTPEPVETGAGDPATATVAALLTQQAGGGATPIPTATALPDTGFADDFGVPGLVLGAGVLLVIIILSRRLRTSSS
jgi:type II secretory pathway pseudopilin PulG